jgi:non-specific serine/threonine protein kinase
MSAPAPAPAPAETVAAAVAPAGPLTNLPTARTSFVGRAEELAALIQALDRTMGNGPRLLTLTGVAGCGKTRLALAVAEAALAAYRHGVWLVDLSPLPAGADLTMVVAATLAVLGLHEQAGQQALDTLVASLRPRRLLLVLDNCEHVVAACAALVTRLLGTCPGLQILATSQLPLGIAGETVWQVATLALPDPMAGPPTEAALQLLGQSEAVQLFVQQARAVEPGFALNAATAAGVVALCRQLDGLPLAIELAAARLGVLPLEEILARLNDRFRLLRRGRRTIDDRHQTLQATMDWSYGLLDRVEQAVLCRLAVFAGGWDLAAAEAVGAGETVAVETMLDTLDELLDRSLVYAYQSHGAPRYGMLETVRQYGLLQLERAGEAALIRDRHLDWCVALAEQAAPALQGPEQGAWLAQLDREHDNLRAALQWALDRGLGTLGLRMAAGIWRFWLRRGHQREGRRWLAALLALAAGEDATSMALRASALEGAARLAEDQHDFAQAAALFAQSVSLRHAPGEDERARGVVINAAMEARAQGDYARAGALLEECLAQYRSSAQRRERAMAGEQGLSRAWGYRLTLLALVLREQGEYTRATALCDECLALARELGDTEGIANALLGLGDLARDRGDAGRVRAYCEECLVLFRDLYQQWAIGFTLNNLALAAYLDGDLALAASHAQQSDSCFRGLQGGTSLAEVLITVGRISGAQGDGSAARASLTEALRLAWAKGPRLLVAAALEELGMLTVRQKHEQHGVQLLAAAAALRQAMGTPIRPADRSALEGALAAARTSVGSSAFADAWVAGETLPLEQIVAHAAHDA